MYIPVMVVKSLYAAVKLPDELSEVHRGSWPRLNTVDSVSGRKEEVWNSTTAEKLTLCHNCHTRYIVTL